VGVPEITPPDDMMRPGGSDPPVTDHEVMLDTGSVAFNVNGEMADPTSDV
jgi:hypothetical protein